jgi:hypothetical protein
MAHIDVRFSQGSSLQLEGALANLAVHRESSSTSTESFTVDYSTTDLTASSGSDYTSTSGTLTFAVGQNIQYISVNILADSAVDPSETFYVNLSNLQTSNNATTSNISLASHLAIIVDQSGVSQNPTTPTKSPASAVPGTPSNINVRFVPGSSYYMEGATFSLAVEREDGSSNKAFSIDYNTSDVTAAAGADYNGAIGTLSFSQNENVKYISITILTDSVAEPFEYFHVSLSNFQCSDSNITHEITLSPHTGIIIGSGSGTPDASATPTVTLTIQDIILPISAPNVVLIDGKCYYNTSLELALPDVIKSYTGDFSDCEDCEDSISTPTVSVTPTLRTPTPTLTSTPDDSRNVQGYDSCDPPVQGFEECYPTPTKSPICGSSSDPNCTPTKSPICGSSSDPNCTPTKSPICGSSSDPNCTPTKTLTPTESPLCGSSSDPNCTPTKTLTPTESPLCGSSSDPNCTPTVTSTPAEPNTLRGLYKINPPIAGGCVTLFDQYQMLQSKTTTSSEPYNFEFTIPFDSSKIYRVEVCHAQYTDIQWEGSIVFTYPGQEYAINLPSADQPATATFTHDCPCPPTPTTSVSVTKTPLTPTLSPPSSPTRTRLYGGGFSGCALPTIKVAIAPGIDDPTPSNASLIHGISGLHYEFIVDGGSVGNIYAGNDLFPKVSLVNSIQLGMLPAPREYIFDLTLVPSTHPFSILDRRQARALVETPTVTVTKTDYDYSWFTPTLTPKTETVSKTSTPFTVTPTLTRTPTQHTHAYLENISATEVNGGFYGGEVKLTITYDVIVNDFPLSYRCVNHGFMGTGALGSGSTPWSIGYQALRYNPSCDDTHFDWAYYSMCSSGQDQSPSAPSIIAAVDIVSASGSRGIGDDSGISSSGVYQLDIVNNAGWKDCDNSGYSNQEHCKTELFEDAPCYEFSHNGAYSEPRDPPYVISGSGDSCETCEGCGIVYFTGLPSVTVSASTINSNREICNGEEYAGGDITISADGVYTSSTGSTASGYGGFHYRHTATDPYSNFVGYFYLVRGGPDFRWEVQFKPTMFGSDCYSSTHSETHTDVASTQSEAWGCPHEYSFGSGVEITCLSC